MLLPLITTCYSAFFIFRDSEHAHYPVQSRNCGPRTKSQGTLQISNYPNGPLHNTPDPINQKRGVTCLLAFIVPSFTAMLWRNPKMRQERWNSYRLAGHLPLSHGESSWKCFKRHQQRADLLMRKRKKRSPRAKMLMPFRSGELHPFCYQSSCVCSCQQNLDQTFKSPKFKKILFAIARVSFNS